MGCLGKRVDADVKLKCNQVILSEHAAFRLSQRAPKIRPYRARSRIQHRIAEEQKRGIAPDWDGAVHVMFAPGVWAVCHAAICGGWYVKTVYVREIEGEEMKA